MSQYSIKGKTESGDCEYAPALPADENSDVCGRCIVCGAADVAPFQKVRDRQYFRCRMCLATFLHPAQQPGPVRERQRYLEHNNDMDDPGYLTFLQRLAEPVLDALPEPAVGLDYGSGPEPVLADMLEAQGHQVACYDPFFQPDPSALKKTYDFITCCETAEHFHDPFAEFSRLDALLRPSGVLGIMTCFQTRDERFANWHYRRDFTHVVFYREETMRSVADQFGWDCDVVEKDVVLMLKP